MENKLDDQLLIIKYSIDSNEKMYYEFIKMESYITYIKKMFKHMMSQKQNSSPGNMDPPKPQYLGTVV